MGVFKPLSILFCIAAAGIVYADPDEAADVTQADAKGGLQAQEDRLSKEETTAVAEQAAAEQTYLNKKAEFEKKINQLATQMQKRIDERSECQAHVGSLASAAETASLAVQASADNAKLRDARSRYHADIAKTHENVVEKAKAILGKVREALSSQEDKEGSDKLAEIEEACDRLDKMLDAKLEHSERSISTTKDALECTKCSSSSQEVEKVRTQLGTDMDRAKTRCNLMIEEHKSLDAAAVEESETLKKRLQQLENTRRVQLTYFKQRQESRKQREELVKALRQSTE